MTITVFCKEHGVSKQQFHYHKKKLREVENPEQDVFHKVSLNNEIDTNKKTVLKARDIKISIGNIIIDVSVS